MAGSTDPRRVAGATVVGFGISGGDYNPGRAELLVVFKDGCNGEEKV